VVVHLRGTGQNRQADKPFQSSPRRVRLKRGSRLASAPSPPLAMWLTESAREWGRRAGVRERNDFPVSPECETHFVIVAGLSESVVCACPADRGGEWGTTMKRVSRGS